jgi:hypothetical protein
MRSLKKLYGCLYKLKTKLFKAKLFNIWNCLFYQLGNLRKTKLFIISNRFFVLSYRMTCENGTRSWARRRRRFRRSAWPPRTPSACFRLMFAQSFVFFQVSSFKTKFVLSQKLLLSLVLLYWGLDKVIFCSEATFKCRSHVLKS